MTWGQPARGKGSDVDGGVRSTRNFIQTVADENGDPVRVRSYMEDVLRPREIGLRFSYDFKL